MYQYRITVNESQGSITENYPAEQWKRIFEVIESRGGKATLERRLITDVSILSLLTDTKGYIKFKEKVICPFEILAELTS